MIAYPAPLIEATLLRRYKRFLCDVRLPSGQEDVAHCPNPGSMKSCWEPGARCRLSKAGPGRKLGWTVEQICMNGTWIGVHTGRPNAVVEAAIQAGQVPELAGYPDMRREVRWGEGSRVDLLLQEGPAQAWVEVKNVTLAEGNQARFPDAVTKRGAKHLRELMRVVSEGYRGVLFFHVARGDVTEVAPADDIDPTYGELLRSAIKAGVEVLAYRAVVDETGLALGDRLPLRT